MTIQTNVQVTNESTRSCCGKNASECQCNPTPVSNDVSSIVVNGIVYGRDADGKYIKKPDPIGGIDHEEVYLRNSAYDQRNDNASQQVPRVAGNYVTADGETIQRPTPLGQPEWHF